MVLCPKCGASLNDDVLSCGSCGFSLIPEDTGPIQPLTQDGVNAVNIPLASTGADEMPDISVAVEEDSNYISPLDDFSYFGGTRQIEDDPSLNASMPTLSFSEMPEDGPSRLVSMPSVQPAGETMPTLSFLHEEVVKPKPSEPEPSMPSLDFSSLAHKDK